VRRVETPELTDELVALCTTQLGEALARGRLNGAPVPEAAPTDRQLFVASSVEGTSAFRLVVRGRGIYLSSGSAALWEELELLFTLGRNVDRPDRIELTVFTLVSNKATSPPHAPPTRWDPMDRSELEGLTRFQANVADHYRACLRRSGTQ
jgi:hypothetical protein